jgi:hypothetical protein
MRDLERLTSERRQPAYSVFLLHNRACIFHSRKKSEQKSAETRNDSGGGGRNDSGGSGGGDTLSSNSFGKKHSALLQDHAKVWFVRRTACTVFPTKLQGKEEEYDQQHQEISNKFPHILRFRLLQHTMFTRV